MTFFVVFIGIPVVLAALAGTFYNVFGEKK